MESLAIKSAKKLFGAKYANVQPLSASIANTGILLNLLNYKDKLLSLNLLSGGHLTQNLMMKI